MLLNKKKTLHNEGFKVAIITVKPTGSFRQENKTGNCHYLLRVHLAFYYLLSQI